MKYNININQLVLSKTSLDLIDSAILDYIIVICNSKSKAVSNKRKKDELGDWTWINFNKLIQDMPLLRIKSKSTISERIKKISKVGFLRTNQAKDKRLFVQLTEKTDSLFLEGVRENEQGVRENEQGVRENEQGVRENEQEVFVQTNIHNNTNINNNTNDNEETKVSTPKQIAENFFMIYKLPEDQVLDEVKEIVFNLREKYGKSVDFEIKKFISYWTEPTPSGKKQRWEIEKTFEVKRRLITWLSRANKFSGQSNDRVIIGLDI